MSTLLLRDEFRRLVFERDGGLCVVCKAPAKDAHHIIERRLFADGGYYLNNGASVCHACHYCCETTEIAVEDLRIKCGITKKVLPPDYYDDQTYDKWGNPVLPNGQRLRGELFFDESVQKVLTAGGVLSFFTSYVKYPRTRHLPWSDGMTDDDRLMDDLESLIGQDVVVTEKMDGENTTLYHDYIHARSIDGRSHPSRSWVKRMHGLIANDIPEGWRICGENLFAEHSIHYSELPTFFMGFSIWNDKNECLSWDETLEWFTLIGIKAVPTLYQGPFNEKAIRLLFNEKRDWDKHEGYVVRTRAGFSYADFPRCVGKYVRKDHVRTAKHWMQGQHKTNEIA